jgi:hypothetical protein
MSEIQLVTFLDSGDFASAKPFGFQEIGRGGGDRIASLTSKSRRRKVLPTALHSNC